MPRGAWVLTLARRWWLAPLLCTLVSLGMFASSPTMAAPDAEIHLGTAWYDIHHGIPNTVRINVSVVGPCYDLRPQAPADCRTPLGAESVLAYTGRLVNYPPPIYWVMGAGELATGAVSSSLVGDGGRLFGLLACLGLLYLAAWRLHRARERSAIWALYLLTPPMATFLFVGANPNGWEVACALFFSATLLYRRGDLLTRTSLVQAGPSIAIAGILLSTSRADGALWSILIAGVFVLWSRAWSSRGAPSPLVVALLPAIAFGVIWNAQFPYRVQIGKPAVSLSAGGLLSAMAASMQDVFSKLAQVWGVLGWADTIPSFLVLVGLIGALVYFFPTYAPTRSHRRLLVAILFIVFAASVVLEALGWRSFPYWWQGRYSLPLLAGLAMLLFSDPGERERPGLFALAAWVTIFNAYMICLNYWRYDYGILNGIPAQIKHAAYRPTHAVVVYGIVLVLVAGCVILFLANGAQHADDANDIPRATSMASSSS
jgi:hypothetical protein